MVEMMARNGQINTKTDFVVFADTWLEHPETYRFIWLCAERWQKEYGIPVYCTYYPGGFVAWVKHKKFLPNPVQRRCTADLKVSEIDRLMQELTGAKSGWSKVLGIRYDEPKRINRDREDFEYPLYSARVTKEMVLEFWATQMPFDLQIHGDYGNCTLCFLKSRAKLQKIIQTNPEFAAPWLEMEEYVSEARGEKSNFRMEYSYKQLVEWASQPQTQLMDFDAAIPCFCHD